jgi:hypothetical protein
MLGDRVETVTPWLVQQMLENRKTGARFQWLTTPRLFARLLGARFIKRNLFDASEG